ncbi:A-kinase anchor protein 10, mitochondrial [Rhincodon typus]|uniref:A-kinase anchor protein 10, mitochondrial n=1 Tax=Rhincodon typus TaxID=259920 RepID=UPI00202E211A|nr:A-kinase anchor protein 10, mitochondrial [Rhincodon typus]
MMSQLADFLEQGQSVYLPGFLSSNLYYKYLNDLIHSVRNDEFSGAYTPFLGHGPNSPHEHEPSIGLSDGSVAQTTANFVPCVNKLILDRVIKFQISSIIIESRKILSRCAKYTSKAKGEKEKFPESQTNKVPATSPVATPSPSRSNALLEAAGPSYVAINAISANMDSFARGRTAVLNQQPIHMEAAHFGDLGHSCLNYKAEETNSRLSKTLEQVLQDSTALPYIIQFMEMQGVEHLVKFWLEAESFRSTSWSRIRAHSLNTIKHSSLAEPASPANRRCDVDVPVSLDSSVSPELKAKGNPVSSGDKLNVSDPTSLGCIGQNKTSPNHSLNQGGSDLNPLRVGASRAITIQTGSASQESQKPASKGHALQTGLKGLSDKLMKSIERDAVNIFTKYISPDASRPIPIIEAMRNDIVAKICGEDGQADPNCFVSAQAVVYVMMEKDTRSCLEYYDNPVAIMHGTRKATVKILKNFDEAIVVDAASLEPESLYHRTFAGRMTFGKINELGQFIRESEPEPDVKKSKGSMFSQAMKKWVQGSTDEAQEEMAWRIAKMIVNDVVQQAQSEPLVAKSTKWTRM